MSEFKVGDRVCHRKEPELTGTIKVIEENELSVMVLWDDSPDDELDFQWIEKLRYID